MMSGMTRRITTSVTVAFAITLVASAALVTNAAAQTPTPPAAPPATSSATPATPAKPAAAADVSSLDGILHALYDVISGPAGQKRDPDRLRSLFADGARLIPATKTAEGPQHARVLDVDGYINRAFANMEKTGFFEKEIARRVDQFGSIAQVFSTYESKRAADDAKPFARGINSIQVYFDGTRYWIITVLWDAERPDNPLPAKYLESAK
jgi:hypothetical protein